MTRNVLPPGCRIVHGAGASVKRPFADMPLTMHELSPGGAAFSGQLGFIPFTTAIRLPRHIHMSIGNDRRLLAERILVLNGAGLVELAGTLHVVAPGSLVEIAPGVPHTWTACPAGLALPDGTRTDGTFLMVYDYEAPTAFSPTARTQVLAEAVDYAAYEGDFEQIRISALDASEVLTRGLLVTWDGVLLPLRD